MTAEIAIMNKLGLALGADSAITSGRSGYQKVYNTAHKLFSLTENHPVGLMVYGSASFMEVPWEVIIKSYRASLGAKQFDDLAEYGEDFRNFLTNDARFRADESEEIIVYRTFSDILKNLLYDVEEKIKEENNNQEVTDHQVTEWLQAQVNKKVEGFKKMEELYLNLEYKPFLSRFRTVIEEVITELVVYEIPENLREDLLYLSFISLQKDYFSRGSSGLVIAGYGEKEIFPHLLEYRLEGFVFGQLKYKCIREKKISYTNDKHAGTAAIVPFAQQEMVYSFMNGVEPELEETYSEIIKKVALDYHSQIASQLGVDFTAEQVTKLEEMGRELYKSVEESVKEYQYNHYIEPLMGIVRSLPKEELAEMAEALVNLTSFKRRVSRDTESVGGPVDVAVITKGDGFVWIKRKNYFDPELNPRYFNNVRKGDMD